MKIITITMIAALHFVYRHDWCLLYALVHIVVRLSFSFYHNQIDPHKVNKCNQQIALSLVLWSCVQSLALMDAQTSFNNQFHAVAMNSEYGSIWGEFDFQKRCKFIG